MCRWSASGRDCMDAPWVAGCRTVRGQRLRCWAVRPPHVPSRRALGVILLALSVGPPATSAEAASVRVPADYFGMNLQRIETLDPGVRSRQLVGIADAGSRKLRINLSWATLEPEPVSEGRAYRFDRYDPVVADAARRGIRIQPTLVQTPSWAWGDGTAGVFQCTHAQSRRPA